MSNINQNLKKLNSFTTHFKTFFNLSPKGKNITFQNKTKKKKKRNPNKLKDKKKNYRFLEQDIINVI